MVHGGGGLHTPGVPSKSANVMRKVKGLFDNIAYLSVAEMQLIGIASDVNKTTIATFY